MVWGSLIVGYLLLVVGTLFMSSKAGLLDLAGAANSTLTFSNSLGVGEASDAMNLAVLQAAEGDAQDLYVNSTYGFCVVDAVVLLMLIALRSRIAMAIDILMEVSARRPPACVFHRTCSLVCRGALCCSAPLPLPELPPHPLANRQTACWF